jgi:hypothetical protein
MKGRLSVKLLSCVARVVGAERIQLVAALQALVEADILQGVRTLVRTRTRMNSKKKGGQTIATDKWDQNTTKSSVERWRRKHLFLIAK